MTKKQDAQLKKDLKEVLETTSMSDMKLMNDFAHSINDLHMTLNCLIGTLITKKVITEKDFKEEVEKTQKKINEVLEKNKDTLEDFDKKLQEKEKKEEELKGIAKNYFG